MSERVALGGECEKNSTYHLMPDYGLVELIKEDGSQCREEGEEGEIVGTSFFNFSMPLIRYKTAISCKSCRVLVEWKKLGPARSC